MSKTNLSRGGADDWSKETEALRGGRKTAAGAECGRTIRVLTLIDAYTRECLALEVDRSFASRRVTRVLEQIVARTTVGDPLRPVRS
jgi:hypothetical protein